MESVLWMLGSSLAFTVLAVLVRQLDARGHSEGAMFFWRAAAGLAASIPFALFAGKSALQVKRWGPLTLRSLYGTLGFLLGFYALANLELADAQAISFSRTLFMTALAAWVLREAVGPRRWTATFLGFLGVLLMVRPDQILSAQMLNLGALAALGSAFFFAIAIITVKDLTRDHSAMALVFWANVFTTVAGIPFALGAPAPSSLTDYILLILLGLAGVAAQACYVRALSIGEASFLGLVDYVRLPLMALVGFLFFQEVPDQLALIGAGIVVASTVYITWREIVLGRTRPGEPADR